MKSWPMSQESGLVPKIRELLNSSNFRDSILNALSPEPVPAMIWQYVPMGNSILRDFQESKNIIFQRIKTENKNQKVLAYWKVLFWKNNGQLSVLFSSNQYFIYKQPKMNTNDIEILSLHDITKSQLHQNHSTCLISSSHADKTDQETLTDQNISNCQCQMIPKLKQKSHKAFMQMLEIQNLYKEEMEQLKEYYEEKEKSQMKKFTIKEKRLEERCRDLEQEIQKVKEAYQREKINELPLDIQSPFSTDGIDSIILGTTPDDSFSSVYQNIRQFIATSNHEESAALLKLSVKNLLEEAEKNNNRYEPNNIISDLDRQKDSPRQTKTIFEQIGENIEKIFAFITTLIDGSVSLNDNLNEVMRNYSEAEARYNKMCLNLEHCQKQSKFMTDYIKKMSQDNLILKRKNSQLEKSNQSLEEFIKKMKKSLIQNGINAEAHVFRREMDAASSHLIGHEEEELNISKQSIHTSYQRKRGFGVSKVQITDRIFPTPLNFKKKGSGRSPDFS